MALLPNNPLITIAQGNQTPIGAPPVAAGPTGFQQFSQGLLGNPLFGLGAGLLAGAAPGGTFAGGLNIGLQNMLQMQRQQQATALMGARLQEMRQERQRRERQEKAIEMVAGQLPQLEGDYIRAGLTPPTPAGPMSGIAKLQADLSAGRINEDQYNMAVSQMGAPSTVVEVNQGDQFRPAPLTTDEKQQFGYAPDSNPYWTAKGEIKVPPREPQSQGEARGIAWFAGKQADRLEAIENTGQLTGAVPLAESAMPDMMQSELRQTYDTEAAALVDRLNSYWSGAEVRPDEIERRTRNITILPTDRPARRRAKQRLRRQYIEEMNRAYGVGGQATPGSNEQIIDFEDLP